MSQLKTRSRPRRYVTRIHPGTALHVSGLTPPKGKEGVVAVKTTQALLIAHHPDSIQTPNAFNSVVELAEYLKKVGY